MIEENDEKQQISRSREKSSDEGQGGSGSARKLEENPKDGSSSRSGADQPKEDINSVLVEKYLKGVRFPASKKALLDQANKNNAPSEVSKLLGQITDEYYKSVTEVTQQINKNVA